MTTETTREQQIKQNFNIDANGRLTPEHQSPTGMGPGRHPEGGGVSLTVGLGVFLLFVAVLSLILMLLFGGGA